MVNKYPYGDKFLTRDDLLLRPEVLKYLRRNGKEKNEKALNGRFYKAAYAGNINKEKLENERYVVRVKPEKKKKKIIYHDAVVKGKELVNRSYEPTDYDKLMSDFLASDKSEEYKRSILSLPDTDYSNYTYDDKKEEEKINENLALKLNEIEFKKFNAVKLKELARNLCIKNYGSSRKQVLVEKIELVRKQFCKGD